jgi:hypothetical protein
LTFSFPLCSFEGVIQPNKFLVTIAEGQHLATSRTQQLSPPAVMVLPG